MQGKPFAEQSSGQPAAHAVRMTEIITGQKLRANRTGVEQSRPQSPTSWPSRPASSAFVAASLDTYMLHQLLSQRSLLTHQRLQLSCPECSVLDVLVILPVLYMRICSRLPLWGGVARHGAGSPISEIQLGGHDLHPAVYNSCPSIVRNTGIDTSQGTGSR